MTNNEEKVESAQETDTEYVPKQVYKQVSEDMHKYKSQLKEYKAQLDAIKADNEAKEKQSLYEQEKWKELFQKNEQKLKEIESERDNERSKFLDTNKKIAVERELGGFKKPEYLKFIDVKNVEIDDNGSIVQESLANEVQRIKANYPELIKNSEVKPLPGNAPKAAEAKSLSQMSEYELSQARRQLLNKK